MALRIATKASQALTLPALLVVTYINDSSPKRSITVEYADADSLSSTDKSAAVEFLHGANTPVTGDIAFVEKLVETYPDILKGKDAASVRIEPRLSPEYIHTTSNSDYRRENGSLARQH